MPRRRFNSEFDADELNKITHRGLQPRSRVNEPRPTHENFDNLKEVQKGEQKFIVKVARFFAGFFGGIGNTMKGLLTPRAKKVMQCQTYGHVMQQGWTGPHPKCIDCGVAILSLDQVRSSTPKSDRKDNPGQQPYQNDRKYVK